MDKIHRVPPTIRCYEVPATVLTATIDALRGMSKGQRESIVLWSGRIVSEERARVVRLLIPRQNTGRLHFNVPLRERMQLIADLASANELALVQLHTHPQRAFHSEADDQLAIIKHVGALSVVVPEFGSRWTGDFSETSVNIHEGRSVWRELTPLGSQMLFEVMRWQ